MPRGWFDWGVAAAWHRFAAADGAVVVWLPPGGTLAERPGGLRYWSPDPELGRFTVASGEASGDDPLAAERAHGELAVEVDEELRAGGHVVRRLRYRVRRSEPHVLVGAADGPRHAGGEDVEHVSDALLLCDGARLVRVGYTVRADAPADVRATFADVLARVELAGDGPVLAGGAA